jgi:LysM repeat protein
MTTRHFSSLLAFALFTSPFVSFAQAPAAAPADTNTAPIAPAAPAAAPVAPTEPTAAPVASGDRPTTYTIAQGDSLWTVAHKYGTTVVALRKANNLKKGALLHPGQVLQLPPAKTAEPAK